MPTMMDATRVSGHKKSPNRQYGPLLKLAAQIRTEIDGHHCSVKTVHAVINRHMKSGPVLQAIKQAKRHPEYIAWDRKRRRKLKQTFEEAKRRLEALQRRFA